MNTWILILYIYAGAFAKGDSVTLTNVPGFPDKESCQVAGQTASSLVLGSAKEFRFVCLKGK